MRPCAIVLASAMLCLEGCATTPRNPLEPAAFEDPAVAPGDAIEETVEGVHVTAAVEAWPGTPAVLDHVTPVRLTIRNDSGQPIRVHLSDMRLVDDRGGTYAALPLYLINGRAEIDTYAYRPTPGFDYDRYYIDSPYAPYYGGFGVYDYGYPYDYYDYYDYDRYYEYWNTVPLPTQRMVDLVIPEGVVEDGGFVSGFVYFERVNPARSAQATFLYDVVDAKTGKPMGRVDLVFDVVPPPP